MVAAPAGRKVATAAAAPSPTSGRPVKLFVGGLTRNTTTKLLREHFGKYGRILDCVAMCQADGKPRGFGYVTLDSPTAADHCLAEPQVIDGRVVDMKRAVPAHGKAGSCGTAAETVRERPAALGFGVAQQGRGFGCPPGAWDALLAYQAEAYATQAAAASAWASTWADLDGGLDCLEVLRRGSMPPSPCEALNLVNSPAFGAGLRSSLLDTCGAPPADVLRPLADSGLGMSAAAQEFVPLKRSAVAAILSPQKVALPTPVGGRARCALGDITNQTLGGDKFAKAPQFASADFSAPLKELAAGRSRTTGQWILPDFNEGSPENAKENLSNLISVTSCKSVAMPPGLSLPPGLEGLNLAGDGKCSGFGFFAAGPSPKAAAAR